MQAELPLLEPTDLSGHVTPCCTLINKSLFLKKTLVITIATYLFVPLMALHDEGKLPAVAYASILITLHLGFIMIYFYRVSFNSLDSNWRSLAARIVGLLACVVLLGIVAGHLDKGLGMLSLELIGLVMVHTLILALLMTKCSCGGKKNEADKDTFQDSEWDRVE